MSRVLWRALALLAVALLLGACDDATTGVTNVRKDAGDALFSATLNATGSCDSSCAVFMRWRQVGAASWIDGPQLSTGKVSETAWSQTASGLARGSYEYQACGSEAGSAVLCVGPGGNPNTTSPFRVRQGLREFSLPAPFGCCVGDIATGSDGALWFTDVNPVLIGRITAKGQISHYAPSGQPLAITAGPDGALWFTEWIPSGQSGVPGEDLIGRISTGGQITEYPLHAGNNQPADITSGPDGALWFTDYDTHEIGRITTSGQITEFPTPSVPPSAAEQSIASGPDGALWFTQLNDTIGRITTTGTVTEYPVDGVPTAITAGPDGAMWFVDGSKPARLGRLTTSGAVSYFPLPAGTAGVIGDATEGIASGADGALWVTDGVDPTSIFRVTTNGTVTTYPLPSCGNSDLLPMGITRGPKLQIWFTEQCFTGNLTPWIGRLLAP
jgi:virginiamycin B lyase